MRAREGAGLGWLRIARNLSFTLKLPECGVDGLATCHAVLVCLLAPVRNCVQVLYAGLTRGSRTSAEEALVAPLNKTALELLHREIARPNVRTERVGTGGAAWPWPGQWRTGPGRAERLCRWRSARARVEASRALRRREDLEASYRYFAAVMNWSKVSHQTITVLKCAGSIDSGTATRKFLKVFTSPTRAIFPFRRLKSASVSTNSGDK